ncbi:hypothetical protein VTK26DRAFT_2948 [Humicola hyalothermophila]
MLSTCSIIDEQAAGSQDIVFIVHFRHRRAPSAFCQVPTSTSSERSNKVIRSRFEEVDSSATMGERHQLFVIARVGKQYRCLAIVHHQYLAGWDVLAACIRLISIFSDKSNRLPLEIELRLANDHYKDRGPPEKPTSLNFLTGLMADPVRFPFINTCLVLGTSSDPDNRHFGYVHPEPPDLAFDQTDNNTGITILDITDLDNIKYCFLAWHPIGYRYLPDSEGEGEDGQVPASKDDVPPPLNEPWSGRVYVRHWVPKGEHWNSVFNDPHHRSLITRLDEVPLIQAPTLANLWPWGPWIVDESTQLAPALAPRIGPSSLHHMALKKLVQEVLASPKPDLTLFEEARRMPTFRKSLMEHLYAAGKEVASSPGAPELLREAFAGESLLDWTRFPGLTPATMMAAFNSGPELRDARALALTPDWDTTTASELAQATCTLPSLLDLFVMELPGRDKEGPTGEFYKALAAHPRCPRRSMLLTGAASCALNQRIWLPTAENIAPPPPFPAVQLVIHRQDPLPERYRPMPRPPEFFYYYFGDGFLTPVRLVDGLLTFFASALGGGQEQNLNRSAAHCFSYANTGLTDDSAPTIGPLLAETYKLAKNAFHYSSRRGCFPKMRDLLPGAWTVVAHFRVVRNARQVFPVTKIEYAFIRPKNGIIKADPYDRTPFGPDDLEAVDINGFLQAVAPDADLQQVERKLKRVDEVVEWHRLLSEGDGSETEDPAAVGPLFESKRSMDNQAACDLLKRAIDNLPKVHELYRTAMCFLMEDDQPLYPELWLEPRSD